MNLVVADFSIRDFLPLDDVRFFIGVAIVVVLAGLVLAVFGAGYIPKLAKNIKLGHIIVGVVLLALIPTLIIVFNSTFVFQ